MDKEIHEDPTAVSETLMGRFGLQGRIKLDELHVDEDVLRQIDKIIVVACGTASYAGLVAKYAIEHWVRIPVEVELAHEFRYRDPILTPRTLVVAVSQSGETMDTLMAVRHAREQGSKVLAICNTQGSSIPRESDAVLYTHAGPEVAVASTKAFVAQIAAAYLLGLYLAQIKGVMYHDEIQLQLSELRAMPKKIQWVLDNDDDLIKATAIKLVDRNGFHFLGRHVGYPVALEGALKLKEIAYTFSEGYAAGRGSNTGRSPSSRRRRWSSSSPRPATATSCTQGDLHHRGGQGAWRVHGGRGRAGRPGRLALCGRGIRGARLPDAHGPARRCGAAAAVRHVYGRGEEQRCGQAAQPRQVGDGGVTIGNR